MAFAIGIIYVYTNWFDNLKDRSNNLGAPFYWITNLPAQTEQWVDNRFASRETLIADNESLRTQVLVLQRKAQQVAALEAENLRLRQLLNSADLLDDAVLIAELIGVSPDPSEHKVIINRGKKHGVYHGQAMLDASGLMGQVVEVGENTSKALLITDVNHAIPVQLNRNGVRLIVEGTGDLFSMSIPFVASTLDIQEGDLLVSSGLGQRFPSGYPVATVSRVMVDAGETFAEVTAKPMARLNKSRHVLLVFDKAPAENASLSKALSE